MSLFKNEKIRNAVYLGVICALAYLAVYISRNTLSAVTPEIVKSGRYDKEYLGTLSFVYLMCYAVGQFVNGFIGDKIKGKYMISVGLLAAGITAIVFPSLNGGLALEITYGASGFFLSMIYAPMTKLVSENTDPAYTVRCGLGYNFCSFFGSPIAGLLAVFLTWQWAFGTSSLILIFMGIAVFLIFSLFEKKKIITYGKFDRKPTQKGEKKKGAIRELIKRDIISFSIIAIVTGIVKTSVVFWLPVYISERLGYSPASSSALFTVATLVISINAFAAVFVYEKLKRNGYLTVLISFSVSVLSFIGVYFFSNTAVNLTMLVLAIFSSNCASSILWNVYCPGLRDTGVVSSATGFLDFCSYMAAALASKLFANAVSDIGWKNLILVWIAIVALGAMVGVAFGKKKLFPRRNYDL